MQVPYNSKIFLVPPSHPCITAIISLIPKHTYTLMYGFTLGIHSWLSIQK